MTIIRWILGKIILFFNWLFTPRSIKREPNIQASIDDETAHLTLYQYEACPFCVKVRRAMKRHSLNITTRDAKRSESARKELVEGAGKLKVPCLRIEGDQGEIQWMWDSNDIIGYLENRFIAG